MAVLSNDYEFFTYFNEIGIISQLSKWLFEQGLPEGLTQSQFSVLNWFARVDVEATPGRLARVFQVTGGAMTNTLKKLESKGLVKVEPDKNSGRKKRVTMTRKGRQVRNKAIKAVSPLLKEFAEHFPIEKLRRQTRQLAEVRQYIDEYRYK
jgi:DNA-binding MarR family transcriptional regulator